jgi:ferric-dicitrate binding protein FerR (iron transport regulator)
MDTRSKHIDPLGLLPKVFSGEATPEESRIVDEWMLADPSNRTEFDTFAKLWNITLTASTSDYIDLNAEWQKMESVITPASNKTLNLVRILQIAASIVLISTLAFFGLKTSSIRSEKAPSAKLLIVNLPDGTIVSLNAGSKIIYKKNFGISHRNLSLKGEAYFEVKKNNGLPFIVNAGEAEIRVTGTKFNVKAYSDKTDVKVTVTEGKVIFYETRKRLIETALGAGETGTYDKSVKAVRKQAAVNINDLAWKTMIMDFHNTPLIEVADILMNTYHTTLDVDPTIKNCTVTVRFEDQKLDSVLNVLKSTLDLTITSKGKGTIISGKGC